MNWIVILTQNNLALTRNAIATLRDQDIGDVRILAVDNDSSDGTQLWLGAQSDIVTIMNCPAQSVAGAWNQALRWIFSRGEDYALVVNNDVELRPDTYRHLAADGGLFVTCVGNRDPKCIGPDSIPDDPAYPQLWTPPDPSRKRPHPDFSCYLIRRDAWERVGTFDEKFLVAFCEDWDYHVRLHNDGITAECLDLPFYHAGSATVKMATPEEQLRIHRQAEANRKYFEHKWGFKGASPEYYEFFGSSEP